MSWAGLVLEAARVGRDGADPLAFLALPAVLLHGEQVGVLADHALQGTHGADRAPDSRFKVDAKADGKRGGDDPHHSKHRANGLGVTPGHIKAGDHKPHHCAKEEPAEPARLEDGQDRSLQAHQGEEAFVEGPHGAKPATVKPSPSACQHKKQGDKGKDRKAEPGAEVTADDDQRQEQGHEVLADIAAADLLGLIFWTC